MFMKSPILLLLSFGFLQSCNTSSCLGRGPQQSVLAAKAVDFDSAFFVQTQYNANENRLTIQLRLKAGYHVYAPKERIGQPLSVTIDSQGGWQLHGHPIMPQGNQKQLGDETSWVLSDTIAIHAILKPGQGPIRGMFNFHMCTNGACDLPREYAFTVNP